MHDQSTEYRLEQFIIERAEPLRLVQGGRLNREAVAWLAKEILQEFGSEMEDEADEVLASMKVG